MTRWLLAVVLTLSAVPASAEPKWAFPTALGTFAALQGADLALTMHCFGARSCREANPAMRWIAEHPAWAGAVKGTVTIGSVYALHKLHQRHPRVAWVTAGGLIGFQGRVVWRNALVLH